MSQLSHTMYICAVKEGQIWTFGHNLPELPQSQVPFSSRQGFEIGNFNGIPVLCLLDLDGDEGQEFSPLRSLLGLPPELFALAGKAVQLENLRRSQRFCSRCGHEARFDSSHPAMVCSGCGAISYPRISPCVIMAVRCENKILLAQHPRHKNGMYTVLAGFVEAGETLEQCVAREVKEETGIEVDNIRYFGSQPWAFPSNLMVGFLADYKSGDLVPDYQELTDARWFAFDSLPLVAPQGTIARQLIEAVCNSPL